MGEGSTLTDQKGVDMIEHFKLSLESYKELFDSVGEAIYIQDTKGKFLEVNRAAVEMYGYEKSFFPGKDPNVLAAPGKVDYEKSRVRFRKALEGTPQQFEWWGKRKNGEVFPKEVRLTPASYFGKQVVIATARDISDQKMAEEKMTRSIKEKEVLLSEIHHRVKNNLAVIVGLMELQRFNTDNSVAQKILSDSQSRINSMALIHEKLYQSENLMEIRFDNYIEELVKVIFDSHVSSKRADGIQLDIDAEPIAFTIRHAIPCGLLLNEIVTNSLKYAFPDGSNGTIKIRLSRTGKEVYFSICDNGVGLPQEVIEGNSSTLGMKLINSFAKQLGGSLEITCESGTRYDLSFIEERL